MTGPSWWLTSNPVAQISTSAGRCTPSAVVTPSAVTSAMPSVTNSTSSRWSVVSQVPLSCNVRLPIGGYFGVTLSSSSSSVQKTRIQAMNISRIAWLDSLHDSPPLSQSGSIRTWSSSASAIGHHDTNRNHRP